MGIFSVSARPTTSPTIKLEHFPSISNGTTTRCFKTPDIGVNHITTTFIAHVWSVSMSLPLSLLSLSFDFFPGDLFVLPCFPTQFLQLKSSSSLILYGSSPIQNR